MKSEDKKAAVSAYKERKSVAGIYVVRCVPSGQLWVGQAPNVDTVQNRLWFSLRSGGDPHRDVQRAWTRHGPDSFTFETLERLADEDLPYVRQAQLKARLVHWRTMLEAGAI